MTDFDWHAERADLADLAQMDLTPAEGDVDLVAVRAHRLGRVRRMMAAYGIDACLLCDAVNVRYATGARNMQVFTSRNAPARYLLLTHDQSILHEFTGCAHLADGLETLTEVRSALTASYVAAGDAIAAREAAWARETAATLRETVGAGAVVGLERFNAGAAIALAEEGFRIVDAQAPVERARAIKSAEELKCVEASLRATEVGVARLRAAIAPGMTEAALWSVLHQAIIAQNGGYIETRLLNSGERTNPWFQETSAKMIGENELIALDTDVVGCYGYYSDFSRTFHSGPNAPTTTQRELYKTACEQIAHNMSVIEPGLTFKEYSERAWSIPEKYFENRYYLSAHGCGMTGEYPYLYHRADYPDAGYDGVVEPGMTLCVESFIGEAGRGEGVKLEQQILVTETGTRLLSRFPFEEALLA